MRRPRILVVLQGGDAYPTGVVRALNYRDHFRRAGADVTFVTYLPPSLVRLAATPPQLLTPILAPVARKALAGLTRGVGLVNAVQVLRAAKDYDVVYLSTVGAPRLVRQLRKATPARLVYDAVDALWAKSGVPGFGEMLRLMDAVTTDNEHTAAYIRQFQPNCTIVPDSPQLEVFDRYRERARPSPSGQVTLGWIGSPSTTFGLYVIWEALERLFRTHENLHLRLVGASGDPRLLPPFEAVRYSVRSQYSQDEMVQEVLGMDVGLFPLHDVLESEARGVLKACVYMAGEAAVVASPIGRTVEVVRHEANGLLARTTDEWVSQVDRLITDPDLRARLVAAGLETVRSSFTTEQSFEKLYAVLVP